MKTLLLLTLFTCFSLIQSGVNPNALPTPSAPSLEEIKAQEELNCIAQLEKSNAEKSKELEELHKRLAQYPTFSSLTTQEIRQHITTFNNDIEALKKKKEELEPTRNSLEYFYNDRTIYLETLQNTVHNDTRKLHAQQEEIKQLRKEIAYLKEKIAEHSNTVATIKSHIEHNQKVLNRLQAELIHIQQLPDNEKAFLANALLVTHKEGLTNHLNALSQETNQLLAIKTHQITQQEALKEDQAQKNERSTQLKQSLQSKGLALHSIKPVNKAVETFTHLCHAYVQEPTEGKKAAIEEFIANYRDSRKALFEQSYIYSVEHPRFDEKTSAYIHTLKYESSKSFAQKNPKWALGGTFLTSGLVVLFSIFAPKKK